MPTTGLIEVKHNSGSSVFAHHNLITDANAASIALPTGPPAYGACAGLGAFSAGGVTGFVTGGGTGFATGGVSGLAAGGVSSCAAGGGV